MPKQRLKAWLPSPESLRQSKVFGWFAPFLGDHRLWQLNRNALRRGIYVGVLCAFFPLPGQMPLALMGALLTRANVPMSVALTWITNPLTTIPVFWFAYTVGATLLGEPLIGIRTVGMMLTELTLWIFGNGAPPPAHVFSFSAFGLGLLICGVVSSLLAGLIFHYVWQWRIVVDWRKRHGYNENAPKFSTQKGHKSRENQNNNIDDFSI